MSPVYERRVLDFLNELHDYAAFDEEEEGFRLRAMELIKSKPGCFRRSTFQPGHFTGSVWIVDAPLQRALLTHHAKLRIWVQPGGHIDGDESPLEAAFREGLEEAGVKAAPASSRIFDIDIHPIPAKRKEPPHLHFDIRFLGIADPAARLIITEESRALEWVDISAPEKRNQSLTKMARKTQLLRAPGSIANPRGWKLMISR